ncbi:hypothetical protein B0H16DRAFT_1472371 [Mycena metata]|uniref:Uncharacterized protein n=1 Tax=Mycena metata TaxID=1033252 RepID=A0AAD7MN02_9AGAR|nr:hypothetical protein B0H16DRAFT_1472371 [Mycena metata]
MTPPHPFLPTNLASSFTASLSARPHSSWHCIPHLRAAVLKGTVDLNVGRAKLGTFTARRRRHSWRAAADDPTSRGHDGADGGRVDEHWFANVVEVLECLERPSLRFLARLQQWARLGGNVNDPLTQALYPSRSECAGVQAGGDPSDTMRCIQEERRRYGGALLPTSSPTPRSSQLSIPPAFFLKGTKPAGARANDTHFDGAAGSPSVEIASMKVHYTDPLKKKETQIRRPCAPIMIPAVSLERLHYTKMCCIMRPTRLAADRARSRFGRVPSPTAGQRCHRWRRDHLESRASIREYENGERSGAIAKRVSSSETDRILQLIWTPTPIAYSRRSTSLYRSRRFFLRIKRLQLAIVYPPSQATDEDRAFEAHARARRDGDDAGRARSKGKWREMNTYNASLVFPPLHLGRLVYGSACVRDGGTDGPDAGGGEGGRRPSVLSTLPVDHHGKARAHSTIVETFEQEGIVTAGRQRRPLQFYLAARQRSFDVGPYDTPPQLVLFCALRCRLLSSSAQTLCSTSCTTTPIITRSTHVISHLPQRRGSFSQVKQTTPPPPQLFRRPNIQGAPHYFAN